MVRVVGVPTKHGKDRLIAQGFRDISAIEVTLVEIETDTFGTFAGEIPRALSPKETARAKCLAGLEASGLSRMIASEGTFSPHPMMPLLTLNTELLFYIDKENDIELSQSYSTTEVVAFRDTITPETDLEKLARSADLPNHALILRSDAEPVKVYAKGIRTLEELKESMPRELDSKLIVETDFRAMVNPSRQQTIVECAKLLAEKLSNNCPRCQCIGWGIVDYERGLPCGDCGARANREISAEVLGCPKCDFREKRLIEGFASAVNCDFCNP